MQPSSSTALQTLNPLLTFVNSHLTNSNNTFAFENEIYLPMQKRMILLLIAVQFFLVFIKAQVPADTIHISFQQAEKIFIQNNLSLLAA